MHHAEEIVFDFKPDPARPNERAILTYSDKGDGKADLRRLTSPSTENGEGVSRYAKGHAFVRNRLDDGTFPFTIESKVKNRSSVLVSLRGPLRHDGMTQVDPLPEIGDKETSFKTREESGYVEIIGVLYDRFRNAHTEGRPDPTKKLKRDEVKPPAPRMGDAHYWKNVRSHMEEILRVRLTTDVLSNVKILIKTKDIDGKSDQTEVRNTSIIDIFRTSEHVVRITKQQVRDMGNYYAYEEYFYIKRKANAEFPFDKTLANEFPHYMDGMCALFALNNYVVADMRLCDAYDIAATQSTQVNRVAYVNFVPKTLENPKTKKEEPVDINLLPNPATIKVGFEGTVYEEYLDVFRKNKPVDLMCPKMKKKIQSEYDDDDNETTVSSSSFDPPASLPPPPPSSYEGVGEHVYIDGEQTEHIQVPVIPADRNGDLELPQWISKMIGTPSNLTMVHNTATGMYTFTYKRPIHDIDKDTIALALAINDFRRRNVISIANIEIVWQVAASREHQVREKVHEYAEHEHAVLLCVGFTRA